MVEPYVQTSITSNKFLRTFPETVDEESLVWHRDVNTRHMRVIEVGDWYFQKDNILPAKLKVDDEFIIWEMEYHRLIKESGHLIIEITEFRK